MLLLLLSLLFQDLTVPWSDILKTISNASSRLFYRPDFPSFHCVYFERILEKNYQKFESLICIRMKPTQSTIIFLHPCKNYFATARAIGLNKICFFAIFLKKMILF